MNLKGILLKNAKYQINLSNKLEYSKFKNENISQMVAIARQFKRSIDIRDMNKKS